MSKLSPKALRAQTAKARLVLTDIDGVLTGGTIYHFVDTAGELVEFKGIHSQDSIALAWLAKAGLRTGIISGRISKGIEQRVKLLDMRYVYQHRLDKKAVFEEIVRDAAVAPHETLYIGDDLPDIPVLRAAGLAVAVGDARPEVKAAAHWITKADGGRSAVREVAELVLRAQGLWQDVLDRFS